MGANTPTASYVGSRPIAKVASPMRMSDATKTGLRPTLSPRCPPMMPPSGRATNPTPSVANESRVPARGLGVREEGSAEVERGGGAEPDEVIRFDDSSDTGADRYPLGVLVPCTGPLILRASSLMTAILSIRSSWAITVTVDGQQ